MLRAALKGGSHSEGAACGTAPGCHRRGALLQVLNVVHAHGGDVLKFAGDAVMALFKPSSPEVCARVLKGSAGTHGPRDALGTHGPRDARVAARHR